MASPKEKDFEVSSVNSNPPRKTVFYDPSKETRLTRLGLNLESFKRAPGTTACVPYISMDLRAFLILICIVAKLSLVGPMLKILNGLWPMRRCCSKR